MNTVYAFKLLWPDFFSLSKNPAFRLCMDKLLIHSNSNSNLLATGIMGLIPIIQIMVIPIMHLMRYFCP